MMKAWWKSMTLAGGLLLVAMPAMAEPIPPGSYLQSCRDVRVVAGWLKASCQDRNGRWVEATTAVSWCAPGNDIANTDGRLTCQPGGGRGGYGAAANPSGNWGSERPPSGSYMATCRDVRVVAGWLKASCQDRNGRWVEATTAVSWCTAGRDIANEDGRLTCR